MKRIITGLMMPAILFCSCQKNKSSDLVQNKSYGTSFPGEKPVALFKINNHNTDEQLMQGNILDIDNRSASADFYYWDFGNGMHSADRVPENISFSTCEKSYTITLTVQNKSGDVASYSRTFFILCNGSNPGAE